MSAITAVGMSVIVSLLVWITSSAVSEVHAAPARVQTELILVGGCQYVVAVRGDSVAIAHHGACINPAHHR